MFSYSSYPYSFFLSRIIFYIIYNILLGLIFIISSYAIWSGKVWGWYFATAFYIKTLLRIALIPNPFSFHHYTIQTINLTLLRFTAK